MENNVMNSWNRKCEEKHGSQAALLRKIQTVDFALQEVNLFLDTHPRCKKALTYYEMYRKLRHELCMEYTEKYGPLTRNDVMDTDNWTWIDDPWPWEKGV